VISVDIESEFQDWTIKEPQLFPLRSFNFTTDKHALISFGDGTQVIQEPIHFSPYSRPSGL
jgi:hypothetical protein